MSKLIQIGFNAYICYEEAPKCPIFDLDCPYCTVNGECTIGAPMDECDTYYFYNGEEE